MKIVMSHPTGNQNVRAATLGLAETGILKSFNTTMASFPGDVMDRLARFKPLSDLMRRRFDPRIRDLTETAPWLELGRLLAMRAGIHSLTRHEKGMFSIDAVYRNLDRGVARALRQRRWPDATAVYAYEDGARFSFHQAKKMGLQCFYDLPIGYWREAQAILNEQKECWPEWAQTLPGLMDSEEKLLGKDEELRLADRIYVASSFTANTLKRFRGTLNHIEVIPYGFPPALKTRNYSVHQNRPLKLLFVGGLSQRKGIVHLFKVAEALKGKVELTVVGNRPNNSCAVLNTALSRHRWIPTLPHAGILDLMQQHDVLVFPSLFEGFGLVITEAMSQGTPVITTDRTAGPDLIEHGRNGWIIEAGSTQALQNSIDHLLSNRKLIGDVGRASMESARQRPWKVYGRELAMSIMKSKDNVKQIVESE